MIQTTCLIAANEPLNEECWLMSLECPGIAAEARPGQFINIKIGTGHAPLFRRPFSITRRIAFPGGNRGIQILYRVIGEGTRLMSHLKPGECLDVIGPLGRGFQLDLNKKNHILLAGGMGVAGLFMLAEELSSFLKKDGRLFFLLGGRSKSSLSLESDFRRLDGKLLTATDDGSCGRQGCVTDLLLEVLSQFDLCSDSTIYACGPEPMYGRLASICNTYGLPAQVLMERQMMCGRGACLSCVCRVDKEVAGKRLDISTSQIQFSQEENFGYALVCRDGPVFNLDEVIFDA